MALNGAGFKPSSSAIQTEIPPNQVHSEELKQNLELYYELPPIFMPETTRWGDPWSNEAYPSKKALFESTFQDEYIDEMVHYTWICLVRLKDATVAPPRALVSNQIKQSW